jgi:hypothetical protein
MPEILNQTYLEELSSRKALVQRKESSFLTRCATRWHGVDDCSRRRRDSRGLDLKILVIQNDLIRIDLGSRCIVGAIGYRIGIWCVHDNHFVLLNREFRGLCVFIVINGYLVWIEAARDGRFFHSLVGRRSCYVDHVGTDVPLSKALPQGNAIEVQRDGWRPLMDAG